MLMTNSYCSITKHHYNILDNYKNGPSPSIKVSYNILSSLTSLYTSSELPAVPSLAAVTLKAAASDSEMKNKKKNYLLFVRSYFL